MLRYRLIAPHRSYAEPICKTEWQVYVMQNDCRSQWAHCIFSGSFKDTLAFLDDIRFCNVEAY